MHNLEAYAGGGLQPSMSALLGGLDDIFDDGMLLELISYLQEQIKLIESTTGISHRTRHYRCEIRRIEHRLAVVKGQRSQMGWT